MLAEFLERLFDTKPIRLGEANGVVKYRVGYGATDAEQILSIISAMIAEYGVDPIVRGNTTRLFVGCGNDDRSCQFKSVTDFMSDKVRYVRDPLGVEYVRSPTALFKEIDQFGIANGDCDDQVLLAGAMLHSVGFQVRPIGLHLFTQEYFDHVAMQVVGDSGQIVTYDPCNPRNHFANPEGRVLLGAFAGTNA
jgi:hypothetical protein